MTICALIRVGFILAVSVVALVFLPLPRAIATDGVPPEACAYSPIDIEKFGAAPLQPAPLVRSKDGLLETTLTLAYAANRIADCPVHLRAYNGRLTGPTLRARPGDTLRIRLRNLLPANPAFEPADHNVPHNFNTTNLHTHGLHVSPAGNSDNVLLKVEPGSDFDFEIKVPDDHPPGTFWYHAHVHGSTALQVSSGMAGALIIEGGLDDVPAIAAAREQILLFQQIAYDTNGVIENYDVFGPGEWGRSHRQTLINGQIVPRIDMRPGEVQRWRMVHAGVRETLQPVLKDPGRSMADFELAAFSSEVLSAITARVPLIEVAVDGLATGRMDTWDVVELQPGYRSDVLVKAPMVERETVLLLTDGVLPSDRSLLGEPEPERILAMVVVSGQADDMALPRPEELAGLNLFTPVSDEELDRSQAQDVVFDIGPRVCPEGEPCRPCRAGEEGCALRFMINDRPFSHHHRRTLKLGAAAEWTLASQTASHPFHIHVNPFQSSRVGPDGKDQIVWRDTLFVRQGEPPVKVRTRYERYIGLFVIHCHILDHEDQGMMDLVEIVN